MTNNGIRQAEQRVREMNRMAQQYSERGNSFMRQMQGGVPQQNGSRSGFANNSTQHQQPRFEHVNRPEKSAQVKNIPPPPSPEALYRKGTQTEKKSVREDAGESDFFGHAGFKLDNEKLMILLIMYILIKEKADMKLILALGYLLL